MEATYQAGTLAAILLLVMLLAPTSTAQSDSQRGADFTITLQALGPPLYDGPPNWVLFSNSRHGENYNWTIDLPDLFLVGDIRIPDGLFNVSHDRQVVPMVNISNTHYPLFTEFPRDDVWNADSPAQVFRYVDDGDHMILRLGFPGPMAGGLSATRDVTAPEFSVGPIENISHFGFFMETETDELALADLQVRGPDEAWVQNPTAVYAWKQRFPVKGLEPDTVYAVRIIFKDWARNEATAPTFEMKTAPRPAAPAPDIDVVRPTANQTGVRSDASIEVTITAADPDSVNDVRFFVDLDELQTGWDFDGERLLYAPTVPWEHGMHRASVEVYDVHGNQHYVAWRFTVGPDEDSATSPGPATGLLLILGLIGAACVAHARRRW